MSDILNKIKTPQDLADLSAVEIEELSVQLRKEIISTVSINGGHLASNLGVVELTIALLREFDFLKDRIVWDVGHQTYAFKILTGRYPQFCTIRKLGGLSGFPKRCESKYDCFNTGHSSTSISAALGMARANQIKGIQNKVVAVIGDGALTGGMAFEALNDAGQSGIDLIVILNDNQMSINQNVGGLAKHLEGIRVSKKYIQLKQSTYKVLSKTKAGKWLSDMIESVKRGFRNYIRPQKVIFEDLGFKYYGPVDGHDIREIEKHLSSLKKIEGPVLLHVITQKGKGYEFAETSPEKYHGVAPFEIANGISKVKNSEAVEPFTSFSQAFGEYLTGFARNDSSIVAICAAMSTGTGLDVFESNFPKRFFDVGIAEQHAITMAAGMATEGLKPVVAIYSTFLQRAYDQLLHDVALQNLNVVICIDRAGIVGEDGETHQGIYDLAILSSIPTITILSPRNYHELKIMMEFAFYHCKGPVAIRYPRGGEKKISEEHDTIEYDSNSISPVLLNSGNDITIIAEGIMVEKGCRVCIELEKLGVSGDLIDIRMIKPLKRKTIIDSVRKTGKVIVLENAIIKGGLGSAVEELIIEEKIHAEITKIGVGDHILCQGKIDQLLIQEGMDVDSILEKAKLMIAGK